MPTSTQNMDTAEVARHLQKSIKMIQQMARNGELPATKTGGKWIFSRYEMNLLIRKDKPSTYDENDQSLETWQAARYLGIKKKMARYLARIGAVIAEKIDNRWYFLQSDLDKLRPTLNYHHKQRFAR